MLKLAKQAFFLLFLFTGVTMIAKETTDPEYLKYVHEVVNECVERVEKKHGIHCGGSGGSMPYNVKKIELIFQCDRRLTIDEARKIGVDVTTTLLSCINSHEKIRPFLDKYPFGTSDVTISLSTYTKKGGRPLDGSVAHLVMAQNKLFYEGAEIVNYPKTPLYYMNKKNEVVKKMIGGGPKEELVDLYEESFDDALKILASALD